MTPMAGFFGLGPTELVIILVVLVVLFGGSRLAGLGKSSGRAIREFKEETKDLLGDKTEQIGDQGAATDDVVDAELVEPQQQPVSSTTQQTNQRA